MKKMRGKPDLSGIEAPLKDPNDFLEGGAGDLSDRAYKGKTLTNIAGEAPPVATVQKLFRIRWDVAKALKDRVSAESSMGKRVTETEVVESLLKNYLNIDS